MTITTVNNIVSSGLAAARPATPALATPASGSNPSVIYFSTDTLVGSMWDFAGAAWHNISGAGSGTVTSVSLSAPLGGGTVTTSGTLGTTSYTAHGVVLGEGSSALGVTAALTNGQLLIGATGADPALATITAGAGINVVNGPGTVTLSATGAGGTGTGLFSGLLSPPTLTSLSALGMSTAFNQTGTYTQTTTVNSVAFQDTVSLGNADHIEGITMPYPGSPFTLTALVTGSVGAFGSATYGSFGIMAAASTSGRVQTWRMAINNLDSNPLELTNWTTFTTFNGTTASATTFATYSPMWLRWKDDGTNIIVSYSTGGNVFWTFNTTTKASGWLSGNFNLLGFFIDNHNSTIAMEVQSVTLTMP